jgi:hypothetical protein
LDARLNRRLAWDHSVEPLSRSRGVMMTAKAHAGRSMGSQIR